MLKKTTFGQNKRGKKMRAPTFNSQFLQELKHMVHISKNISIFDFASFLLNFIFLFNKKHGVFDSKLTSRRTF